VADIKPVIDAQEVIMVMHVPQDFSRNVKTGRPAEVQLILDGRRSNAAQIVQDYAARIISRLNEELAVKYGDSLPRSVLVSRNWFNPNLEYVWFTVPSLVGILTTLIGLLVTALSVARERELGTFDQLLVSPLEPYEILIGKTVPALIIGIAEGTVMITAAVLVFGVPFTGSLILLYAAMTVYLMSVIGVGLFISSLSKTQQQAILGALVFIVPAVLLSGFATPVENMPEWLQPVTYADPLRHFLVIILGVFLKDMPSEMVLANTWPMAIIALFTLTCAAWFFRRGLE
jgi:ABC-2 type transport system permease protein